MIPWTIIIILAIVVGAAVGYVMRSYGMGPIVCIPIAVIGTAIGAALDSIPPLSSSPFSFYGTALLLGALSLVGGIYAFILTSSERRI